MLLSDIEAVNIIRDGSFYNLSKLNDCIESALVYFDDISFIEELKKHRKYISAIITTDEYAELFLDWNVAIATHCNPKYCFIMANATQNRAKLYNQATSIGHSCKISPKAIVSNNGVSIGDNVVIEDNAVINSGVVIGNNSIIGYGSILGNDGYERCVDNNGNYYSGIHNGTVQIGKNVHIEAYTIIDKSLFNWDFTSIGDNSYLGVRTHIAHGCKLGKCCIVASNAVVLGNNHIGNRVIIGAGAIVCNRLIIGDDAQISLGSVVNRDIEKGTRVTGYLATEHSKYMKYLKDTFD